MAAGDLRTLRVAKTAGRLLSGSAFKGGLGYIVGLPVAAYLTWEGRLIEGKGVSPSVSVEIKPEQLLAGEDPQMERALEAVLVSVQRRRWAELPCLR